MKPLRSHTASSRLQILSKPSHLPLFHPHDDIPSGQPDPTRNIDQNTSEVPLTGWGLRIIVCFVLQMTHSNSGKAKCFQKQCRALRKTMRSLAGHDCISRCSHLGMQVSCGHQIQAGCSCSVGNVHSKHEQLGLRDVIHAKMILGLFMC